MLTKLLMLFKKLKGLFSLIKRYPEDEFAVIITDDFVQVEHPWWGVTKVKWNDLQKVLLINTDKGPWLPDIWLTLVGNDSVCKIPQGTKGYDEVYNIVSNYKGFDFENVIESMTCSDNATFLLWTKK
jgi:hypothetical protein